MLLFFVSRAGVCYASTGFGSPANEKIKTFQVLVLLLFWSASKQVLASLQNKKDQSFHFDLFV